MVGSKEGFFSTQVTVRMGDADLHDRVYLSRFFQWSHQAFEDLLVAGGDRLDRAFNEEGWGMPLVHAETTVHGAVGFPDTLEVRLSIERVGTRSLTMCFDFIDKGDEHVASTRLIHTFAPLDGLAKSIEVPSRLLSVFERLGLLPG